MNGTAARRARILRLRIIEHRVAQAQLARADADVSNLERVAGRLKQLRVTLHPGQGATDGRALSITAEMALRLDHAVISLETPRRDAAARRHESLATQQHAHRKEDSIAKLHERAVTAELAENLRRSDANRPNRRPARNWGEQP